jgi:hypothetical protein
MGWLLLNSLSFWNISFLYKITYFKKFARAGEQMQDLLVY